MIRRSVIACIIVFSAFFAVLAVDAEAGNSSFSIAPAPLANPVFDAKQTDLKVRATYLTMEATDPSNKFDLNGFGMDATGRMAFGGNLAANFNIGVMALSGDIGVGASKADLTGVTVPFSVNVEVQPYKNDVFNVILFAGPAFSLSSMTIENVPVGVIGMTVIYGDMYVDSLVYGLQAGMQAGFRAGKIHIDAFGMVTSQSGTQDTSTSFSDTSTDIPSYTTVSFGIDLMHEPTGITLSSILQDADQGDNKGFKTQLYTLSWSHKF